MWWIRVLKRKKLTEHQTCSEHTLSSLYQERDAGAGRTTAWLKGSVGEEPGVIEGVRRSRVSHGAVGLVFSSNHLSP